MEYVAPYFFLMIISGTILLLLVVMALFRRNVKGAVSYAALMLSVCIWSYLYAVALRVTDPGLVAFFSKYAFIAIAFVPVLWICFVLDYTGREKYLTKRNIGLMMIVPAISVIIGLTNNYHHLFYSVSIIQESLGVPLVSGSYGFWYYVHTVYGYSLLFAGMAYLLIVYLDSPRVYRSQIALVIIGGMLPWVGNLLYVNSMLPDIYFDMTPYFYAMTGLTIYVALFRMPLMKILPIARDSVVENMNDGVMVLDNNQMIVEMNPSALNAFGVDEENVQGIFLKDMLPDFYEFVMTHKDDPEFEELYVCGEGDELKYSNVKSSLLLPGETSHAVILIIRDVTENKKVEKEIAESEEKYRMLYDNLIDAAILHNLSDRGIFGHVLEINRAAEVITGYGREEIKNLDGLMVGKSIPQEKMEKLLEGLNDKGHIRFETEIQHKDGSAVPVFISTHLFNYKGEEVGLSLIKDISLEKDMRIKEKKALVQIESNIEKLNILNDEIRNPLSIIMAIASLGEFDGSEEIIQQVEVIDGIVVRLDRNYLESDKIRKFLVKHCNFTVFDDES